MKLTRYAAYAWGVLAFNLLVVAWGAYVRASGSGAGCGSHWPLCNGEVIPRPEAIATLIELTHRATSGIALILVIGLWFWSRRAFAADHPVRRGATLSLVFIIVEALLGAGLVLFELVADDDSWFRAFSMVAHLANTFVLIAVLTLTAWWATGGRRVKWRGAEHSRWIYAGAAAIVVVGATGAIAALGDTLFPSESLSAGLRNSFNHDSHPLVQLRKYHPLMAIVVGAVLVFATRRLVRSHPSATARALGSIFAIVYGLQILAGAVNIILLAPIAMQIVHLLLADFLWIAFVLFGAEVLAVGPNPAGAGADGRDRLARTGGSTV